MEIDPFIFRLSIFILSIFVGYYVVWSVTPSLHTPLMSVKKCKFFCNYCWSNNYKYQKNSLNIFDTANIFGFLAIILAAINIFGGFFSNSKNASNV